MLEKLIKKMHKKVAFSMYGILEICVLLLPLVIIGFGIYFKITNTNEHGILWIIVGVLCLLFSFRKFKDLFDIYKYIFNPKKYPLYVHLIEEGIDPSIYDQELSSGEIIKNLNKQNPVVITDNFIFGYSQVSCFGVMKENVLWVYEYNGNGIVFYDKYKGYGFTYFPTVDGNDGLIEKLKKIMPFIYYGLDFDYKKVMHEDFDKTVEFVKNERLEFLNNPEAYLEKKAEEERIRIEEENRKLEEEKLKAQEATENSESIQVEDADSSIEVEEVTTNKEENTETIENEKNI